MRARCRDECNARKRAAVAVAVGGSQKSAAHRERENNARRACVYDLANEKPDLAKREHFACEELPRQTDQGIG